MRWGSGGVRANVSLCVTDCVLALFIPKNIRSVVGRGNLFNGKSHSGIGEVSAICRDQGRLLSARTLEVRQPMQSVSQHAATARFHVKFDYLYNTSTYLFLICHTKAA